MKCIQSDWQSDSATVGHSMPYACHVATGNMAINVRASVTTGVSGPLHCGIPVVFNHSDAGWTRQMVTSWGSSGHSIRHWQCLTEIASLAGPSSMAWTVSLEAGWVVIVTGCNRSCKQCSPRPLHWNVGKLHCDSRAAAHN